MESIKNKTLINKLYDGDIPLVYSFWSLAILLPAIMSTFLPLIFSSLPSVKSYFFVFNIVLFFELSCLFFVYKSTKKYKGNRIWVTLSFLVIFMKCLSAVVAYTNILKLL